MESQSQYWNVEFGRNTARVIISGLLLFLLVSVLGTDAPGSTAAFFSTSLALIIIAFASLVGITTKQHPSAAMFATAAVESLIVIGMIAFLINRII